MENKKIAWISGLAFGAMAHGISVGDIWTAILGGLAGFITLIACSGIAGPIIFSIMLWREEEKDSP